MGAMIYLFLGVRFSVFGETFFPLLLEYSQAIIFLARDRRKETQSRFLHLLLVAFYIVILILRDVKYAMSIEDDDGCTCVNVQVEVVSGHVGGHDIPHSD